MCADIGATLHQRGYNEMMKRAERRDDLEETVNAMMESIKADFSLNGIIPSLETLGFIEEAITSEFRTVEPIKGGWSDNQDLDFWDKSA